MGIRGLGIEIADMLTHEVFSRNLRDERAVARYAGLTGSPDESGSRRREKGPAKAGNARVRRDWPGDSAATTTALSFRPRRRVHLNSPGL